MNTLGQRVLYLRELNKIDQQTLSDHTGISRSNISKIERGLITPSAASAVALAQYFNVTTDWLLLGRQHSTSLASDESNRQQLKTEAFNLLEQLTDEGLSSALAFIKFRLYKENQTKAAQ